MSEADTELEAERQYFDSMKQASAAMDIPMRVIKRMKRDGCPGFKGSRVYKDEVIEWLPRYNLDDFTDELSAVEKVQIKVLEERLRKLKLQNDAEERLYIPIAELGPQLVRIAASQRAVLIEKLENDLPERLTGKDAQEIRKMLKGVVDDLCRIFNSGACNALEGTPAEQLKAYASEALETMFSEVGR